MTERAEQLRRIVAHAEPRLRRMNDADVTRDRGPDKWVKKQILGHLIDSAVNNDVRFVLAQSVDPFVGPGYDQNAWNAAHGYRDRAWTELVDVWVALNSHLGYVIARVPTAKLSVRCVIGGGAAVTLEFLIQDYIEHLEHHLQQIWA
ncbi:MAG TPA: DinB family protein [Gemmatimonadales bacterium]|nr:DinB family protein [Gemmatimonadales bacterium]